LKENGKYLTFLRQWVDSAGKQYRHFGGQSSCSIARSTCGHDLRPKSWSKFIYNPFVLPDIYLNRLRNLFYLYIRACYHSGLCATFDILYKTIKCYIDKLVLCGTLLNGILLDSLPLDTRFTVWQQKILKVLIPND